MVRSKRRLARDSQRTPGKVVEIMSDGNREVMKFLEDYIKEERYSLLWIDVMDNYCIYGESILKFFAKCCNESVDRFTETLMDLDNYAYGDYYNQRRMVKDSLKYEMALGCAC